MKWFRKLSGARPAEVQSTGGVLFGLDPPDGCHFDVTNHRGASWHVRIVRDGKDIAHECALIEWGQRDDEKLIVLAAKKALVSFERAQAVSHLEGCYPPKNTNNRGADGG